MIFLKLIRVIHVLDKFSLSSGVSAVVMNLFRNIDKQKFHFDFIVHEETPEVYMNEIESYGGKIYRMPELKYSNTIKYIKALNKFFRVNDKYDIIHGHIANAAVFYITAAKKYGIETRIIHSHSTRPSQKIDKRIRNYILQVPLRLLANHYIACSKASAVYLFGRKAYKIGNVFILKNAIDTKKFLFDEHIRKETREKLKVENKFVVGHVGRFSIEKNHKFIIDIFKEIRTIIPNAVLFLVGDGPLEDKINDSIIKENMSNTAFLLGKRNDIDKLLQAMDVFILPSLFEGLPVSALEAQASGLKCFISDNITKEVNITGLIEFISLTERRQMWAKKISSSNNKYIREDQYSTFIKSGYDIKSQTEELENYYFKILNKQKELKI